MGTAITRSAKASRYDTVRDYLGSDTQYYLLKMETVDARAEAFEACITQLQGLALLDESIDVSDPRLDVNADGEGNRIEDPKLKSPDELVEDEFWPLVAPERMRPAEPKQVYPSWLPHVMATGRILSCRYSWSNSDWMNLPGPIHGYEPIPFEEEPEPGKKVIRNSWKKLPDSVVLNAQEGPSGASSQEGTKATTVQEEADAQAS